MVAGIEPVFVDRFDDRDTYVLEVPSGASSAIGREMPLREALLSCPDAPANLIGTAVQVQHWWRDHRYCGRCGHQTVYHPVERARWCETCEVSWHARLAPCVIVVIRRGDRFLLARSSRARQYYFSLIAGFVEPGESAEEAVGREIMEETGLEVANIRYQASQPWPFPHQLMLGYFADYRSGELVLQEDELADADWFEPGKLPPVPPATTIAGRLINAMEREILSGGVAE
jgi:NAD+ diphosphatase